jgi:hypothetical protein
MKSIVHGFDGVHLLGESAMHPPAPRSGRHAALLLLVGSTGSMGSKPAASSRLAWHPDHGTGGRIQLPFLGSKVPPTINEGNRLVQSTDSLAGTSKNPHHPDRHRPSQRDNHPMSKPQPRSAIKFDLFADAARKHKIETLGDPLQVIARHIDFAHLTQVIDGLLPRGDATKGGRPAYPTEVMVRILILKHLYNLSDEQMEYQLFDRMSYQRFCLLTDSANVPDRNTIWHCQQRLGVDGVTALFQAVDGQLLQRGYVLQPQAPGEVPRRWGGRVLQGLFIKERSAPARGKCMRDGAQKAQKRDGLAQKMS